MTRLRGRSLHEISVRGRQELSKLWDLATHRCGWERTIGVHPAPAAGAPRFFFDAADVGGILALWQQHFPDGVAGAVARADQACSHRLALLGAGELDLGEQIDWHRDVVHGRRAPMRPWFRVPFLDFEAIGDHKFIWEPNRHQHFVPLAQAFLVCGDTRYLDELVGQWRHWMRQNPYPLGINWASSLEVAFRTLSWIWVDQLLRGHAGVPGGFLDELRRALARNASHIERYLSTYFAPNTHLLGEGVALFFVGTLYPSFRPASRWKAKGWRVVTQQAQAQVRSDGLHFEQSIYYHVYALDFFLHSLALAERNGTTIPAAHRRTVAAMVEVLVGVSQSGIAARMGDDDGGRVYDPTRNEPRHMRDPIAVAAALFGRPDWSAAAGRLTEESLWLAGRERFRELLDAQPARRSPRSVAFADCGLHVMCQGERDRWQLVVDAGPHGALGCGHGHADALSVQLSGAGREFLVDCGTFSYVQAGERDRFRGTAAHNTMVVAGADQAEPAGPFNWLTVPVTRVDRWQSGGELDYFRGRHNGYARSSPPVIHERTVVRIDSLWLIRDRALGVGSSSLLISWHLAADLRVRETGTSAFVASDVDGRSVTILAAGPASWRAGLEDGTYSRAYGFKEPTKVLRRRYRGDLPAEHLTALLPGQRPASMTARFDGRSIYDIDAGGTYWRLVFADGSSVDGARRDQYELEIARGASEHQLEVIATLPFSPAD